MTGSADLPLELEPCPKCGAPASRLDVDRQERPVGAVTEITCRNCGHSQSQLIVPERKQD